MALIESYMLPLGTQSPSFSLPNVINNQIKELEIIRGKNGTLIIFMCNHCPYVIHLLEGIIKTAIDFSKKGIATVAISSNSIETHPQDGPKEMKKLALLKKFSFPYLYDESQEVAKNFQAACTPDFFLFDNQLKLYYRGRYDDSRPGNNIPVNGNDLHQASESMLQKVSQSGIQLPSLGCSIKWHPSNKNEKGN